MSTPIPVIHVVAGVLYNPKGAFLLSSRPSGKPYAGYWEFAGGKVEAGESKLAALQREFHEELGIHIHHATPWLSKIHDYEHARVHLYFYRIAATNWQGTLQAHEGQSWCWQYPTRVQATPILPANHPILAALAIPTTLTGTLAQGFTGMINQQEYRLIPYTLAEPKHRQLLFAAEHMGQVRRFDRDIAVWAHVNQPQQWLQVQDADAVLWQVTHATDAEALLTVLKQGSALPIIPLAPADVLHTYAAQWLAAGAHGLAQDTSSLLV